MTEEQIARLYTFTRNHFVEYYDLQTELVDHLAHGIEHTWKEKPNLSFEKALDIEFKKFGVFGFSDVIEKRRSAMNRRYAKIIWSFYKVYFQLPRILMSLVAMLGGYIVLKFLPPSFSYYIVLGTLWGAFMVLMLKAFKFRNTRKNFARKWLLEELIFNQMALLNLALIPIQILSFSNGFEIMHPAVQMASSVFIVCYFLLIYTVTTVIPENARELLKKTYPEYEML